MDDQNRVVVLIDMDCFYCQVEEKLNPELKGKPIAVVQYNPWKGGGIIAVNYVARAMGVTRHMRGDEAKEKCPEIELPSVPCERGKANISKYRDAGKEVARTLQKFTTLLERASIDEAYLDITASVKDRLKTTNINTISPSMMPNTYALGYDDISSFITDVHNYGNESIDFDCDNARMMMVGAVVVSEIRAAVYEETGYRCSAGIAHNKILAKLVCGMNKPNKQTILPKHSVNILYKTLPLKKVKHLGGKFGDNVCELLKISKMGELQYFTEKELQAKFDEKNGTWLYNISRGIDVEPVQARFNPKSIGCCKQFRGRNALLDLESLKKWLSDLGDEIEDRLEKDSLENNRTPKQMVVSFSHLNCDGKDTSCSKSYNFVANDELCGEFFSSKAIELIIDGIESTKLKDDEKNRRLQSPVTFLGISIGKFEDNNESKKTRKIVDFFSAGNSKTPTIPIKNKENIADDQVQNNSKQKCNGDKSYIMQKFLQNAHNNKTTNESDKQNDKDKAPEIDTTHRVFDTNLDKQESFFAKLLNNIVDKIDEDKTLPNNSAPAVRATTPLCKVIECGDSSHDSDYSGSTIDMEINKSIALFDEDPEDTMRVSNMRDLMKSSIKQDENNTIEPNKTNVFRSKTPSPSADTIECSECKQRIPIHEAETHSDYHFALKLREEEKKLAKEERTRLPTVAADKKIDNVKLSVPVNNSLTNFLVKVDDSVSKETCAECGKKIPVESFAEHLDFHEAQKLSRELNKKPIINNYSSNSVKRKRKSASPTKKPKLTRSIDSFFKQ